MKSEFDRYTGLTYIILDSDGNGFCLERQCYLKQRKVDKAIDNVESLGERTNQIATDSILDGNIDTLKVANALDSRLNSIIAKLELSFILYKDN